MAELFTPSAEYDAIFIRLLNINGMIRELQNREGGRSLGDYFHQLTCQHNPIGQIQKSNTLLSSSPNEVIYDMTHDNPSLLDKYGNRMLALPLTALLANAN
jgi:hypothetical protein